MTRSHATGASPSSVFSCDSLREFTGDTIRPGGFDITRRGVDYCKIEPGSPILDIGCGLGASLKVLASEYRLNAVGIEPSPKMRNLGRALNHDLPIFPGSAENIPFPDQSMAAVLAECSLHLATVDLALREIKRVLLPGGWLIVNDVYSGENAVLYGNSTISLNKEGSCDAEVLRLLDVHGYKIRLLEDHTSKLRELTAKLIMRYGTVADFWAKRGCTCPRCRLAMSKTTKMRYYLMVAQSGGDGFCGIEEPTDE